jgi:hypothetical protein
MVGIWRRLVGRHIAFRWGITVFPVLPGAARRATQKMHTRWGGSLVSFGGVSSLFAVTFGPLRPPPYHTNPSAFFNPDDPRAVFL